jgi:hypothetical protein
VLQVQRPTFCHIVFPSSLHNIERVQATTSNLLLHRVAFGAHQSHVCGAQRRAFYKHKRCSKLRPHCIPFFSSCLSESHPKVWLHYSCDVNETTDDSDNARDAIATGINVENNELAFGDNACRIRNNECKFVVRKALSAQLQTPFSLTRSFFFLPPPLYFSASLSLSSQT